MKHALSEWEMKKTTPSC